MALPTSVAQFQRLMRDEGPIRQMTEEDLAFHRARQTMSRMRTAVLFQEDAATKNCGEWSSLATSVARTP